MLSIWLLSGLIALVGSAPRVGNLEQAVANVEEFKQGYGELPDYNDWPSLEDVSANPVQDMGFDPAAVENIEKKHGAHPWVPAEVSRNLLRRRSNRLEKRYSACAFNNNTYYTSVNNSVWYVYCGCFSNGSTLTSTTYCNPTSGSCVYGAFDLQQCIDTCAGNITGLGCQSAEYDSTASSGKSCYAKGAGGPKTCGSAQGNAAFFVGYVNSSFAPTVSYATSYTPYPSSSAAPASSNSGSSSSSLTISTTSSSVPFPNLRYLCLYIPLSNARIIDPALYLQVPVAARLLRVLVAHRRKRPLSQPTLPSRFSPVSYL